MLAYINQLTLCAAFENSLADGMEKEKDLYFSTFSLKDFNEGISAFLEKRPPKFHHA